MKKLFLTNFSLALFLTSNIAFGANEFWVSATATGSSGLASGFATGSINNPLDGSTAAKFDAAMRAISAGSLIHLGVGTFQTMGDAAWGPKTGQHIVGAGIGLTVLQFPSNAVVSGALNRAHVIGVQSPYLQTNITVSDLTVDCNFQSNLDLAPNPGFPGIFTLNGVSLPGSGNTIERVKCINTAAITSSPTNYAEAWGIWIAAFPFPEAHGNLIADCVVSDFHGNYKNDLAGLGLMENNSGIVRNNFITQTGTNRVFGIGPGTHDSVMDGNIMSGVMLGLHTDSGIGLTNVTIVNNQFINCNTAIDWENGVVQDVTIANNNIVLTNTTGGPATVQAFFFHPAPSRFYNVSIKDNSVRVAGTNKFPNQRFIFAYNSHGILIKNNRVDASLPSYFSGCTGITMMDNYDLTGNPLPMPRMILPTPR